MTTQDTAQDTLLRLWRKLVRISTTTCIALTSRSSLSQRRRILRWCSTCSATESNCDPSFFTRCRRRWKRWSKIRRRPLPVCSITSSQKLCIFLSEALEEREEVFQFHKNLVQQRISYISPQEQAIVKETPAADLVGQVAALFALLAQRTAEQVMDSVQEQIRVDGLEIRVRESSRTRAWTP